LNYKRDANDLLLYCLKQLIQNRRYMDRCRRGDTQPSNSATAIEVPEADLIEKVCKFSNLTFNNNF
jgi:hypothetical protein